MLSCTVKYQYNQLNINNDYIDTLHKDLLYIKTECQLYQLPEAVLHMHVNGLLVDRWGGIIKPECFFLQRVEIIR